MTRWTPALLERVRAMAAAGASKLAVMQACGITSVDSLNTMACQHKIKFRRKLPAAQRLPGPVVADVNALALAKDNLKRECALAREEAATAPLFRGGER